MDYLGVLENTWGGKCRYLDWKQDKTVCTPWNVGNKMNRRRLLKQTKTQAVWWKLGWSNRSPTMQLISLRVEASIWTSGWRVGVCHLSLQSRAEERNRAALQLASYGDPERLKTEVERRVCTMPLICFGASFWQMVISVRAQFPHGYVPFLHHFCRRICFRQCCAVLRNSCWSLCLYPDR